MTNRLLILTALCCGLAHASTCDAQTVPSVPTVPGDDTSEATSTLRIRKASTDEIQLAVQNQNYQPVLKDRLLSAVRDISFDPAATDAYDILNATHQATLNAGTELNGEFEFTFSDQDKTVRVLGPTNLQDLKFLNGRQQLTLGKSTNETAVLLVPADTRNVQGYWISEGQPQPGSIVFNLQFPLAVTSKFLLTTADDIVVTSSNGLVVDSNLKADGIRKDKVWILYPSRSGSLTINCSSGRASFASTNRSIGAQADYKIQSGDCEARWNLNFPSLPPKSKAQFSFSESFHPRTVIDAAQRNLPFSWNAEQTSLTVQNSTEDSLSAIVIAGQFSSLQPDTCRLPVLNSGSWIDQLNKVDGKLTLSSAALRVSFAAGMTVSDSKLSGLMETDVEFTADGSQRLALEQFTESAAAEFQILYPEPVLQDEVVMQATDEPGQIKTLIRIQNNSGVAETIRYEVPRKYRVTAVRELDSQVPLLFRIAAGDPNSPTQPIEIFFRSPLTRASQQLLQLRLQSTASEVNLAEAVLKNSDYLRLTDAVVLNQTRLPIGLREADGMTYAEFTTQHPWVPSAEGVVVFNRSQLPKITVKPNQEIVVGASIDHALTVVEKVIQETIQVRLTATPSLPSEIVVQTADSANLTLKPLDRQLGYGLQRRINSRSPNEWTLTIPENERTNSATITMQCERPATGRHIPMLVSLPSTSVRAADIRINAPTADWSLINKSGQSVVDAIAYPDRPLETSLRIQVRNSRDRSKQILGTATWLLSQTSDAVRAEILIQLYAFAVKDSVSIEVGDLTAQRIHCLINGHRTEVEIIDGQLSVLLPDDRQDSQIQILMQNVPLQVDSANRLRLPCIQLSNGSLRGIDTIVTPPSGLAVAPQETAVAMKIKSGSVKFGNDLSRSPSTDIQHFLAKLAFRQAQVQSLFLTSNPTQSTQVLTLSQARAPLATCIILGCMLVILLSILVPYGPIAWVITGMGILIAQGVGVAFPSWTLASSITTAAIAAAGAIIYFKNRFQRIHDESSQSVRSGNQSAVIGITILLIAVANSQAVFAQPNRPQAQVPSSTVPNDILAPENDSPIVFVPPEMAAIINLRPTDSSARPVFLDSEVEISLLTKGSASATVTFHVAVDSAFDQQIELPVADVTLIKCERDGSLILPIRSKSGSPSIPIPAIPQPPARLAPDANVIATPMRGWVAGLKIYELTYTVRMVTRPEVAGAKAGLPLPPAPFTKITVVDETESATEVKLFTPSPIAGVRLGSEFNYPIFNNLSRVDIQFQFAVSANGEDTSPQESEVMARIFATPTAVKIDSDYEVRPADARSESVRLPRLSNMNLVRAEAEDGTVITPAGDDGVLQIPTTVSRQGLQKFKLAWQTPLAFAQEISVNTKELRQLNGLPADRLILAASTSDRFTIASIRAEQTLLEPMPEGQKPSKLTLRPNEQAYLVPLSVDKVTLQIVRLLEAREASLTQSAIVERDQLKWNCECELQIPDEPIFRQTFTVSSNLKIQSVTARSEDIDRLQSWYRDGDQVVVCLREATRGSLIITINGILPRQPQLDTPLPVITLPDPVDVLESYLSLSASEPDSVFIQSSEGTIPNAQFQTETAAVPTTPIRFTVTDEKKPLIIRAEPTKDARATVVALLSQKDGQTQMSIFMAFRAVESPFNLQFSRPSNVAYATSKVLLLPAEGSVLSSDATQQSIDITTDGSVEDNDLSVVVLTGIVPAMTSRILTVPLPVFDAPFEFESLQVLDGRGQNGVMAVPRWVRNLLPELPNATSPGNADSLQVTVSPAKNQIKIQLPLTTSSQDSESVENIPAFAITTHQVAGDEQSVTGTLAALAFSPAANATLEIDLPPNARLMQIRIDGLAAPFQINNRGTVSVTLAERTCLVEMEWLQSVPKNSMLRSAQIKLPALRNVEGSVFIDRKMPSIGWRPRSVIDGPVQMPELLTEITSGLQIIGTSLAAISLELPENNQLQQDPLLGDPAWIELRSQSVDTADAYAQFLQTLRNTDSELMLNKLDTPTPVIEIRQQFPASSLIIILAAVGMLIAGLTTRSSSKTATTPTRKNIVLADTEGSTEIHRTIQR